MAVASTFPVEREGGSFSLSFDLWLLHSHRCFIARASLPSRHQPPSLSVLSLALVFFVSNTTGIVVTMVQLTQRNKVIAYVVAMQSPCCWLSDSRVALATIHRQQPRGAWRLRHTWISVADPRVCLVPQQLVPVHRRYVSRSLAHCATLTRAHTSPTQQQPRPTSSRRCR